MYSQESGRGANVEGRNLGAIRLEVIIMFCVLMKAPNTVEVERKPGTAALSFSSRND